MKQGPSKGGCVEVAPTVRATISFPAEIYAALEQIAKQKKVSLAWVVRDATERYVEDQLPLFGSGLVRQEK